ncbi:MAG: NHLP bacteriocin system secretion protein [Arcobacteraceae bacterium]
MSNTLFRQKNLDNLSSPEELDTLVYNVPSRGWLALGTLGSIIVIAIIWSIFGTISTKVKGNGILLKNAGTGKVYSSAAGTIKKIYIRNGDNIKKGDLIATIDHPLQLIKISTEKNALTLLEEKYKKTQYQSELDLSLVFGTLQRDKENIRINIDILNTKIKTIEEKIKTQKILYEKGLITFENLLESKELLSNTKNTLSKEKNNLVLKNIEAFDKKRERETKLEELNEQIINAKRAIRELENSLKIESEILSNYNGVVFGISTSEGSDVAKGENIADIEKAEDENDLEAVFFVSALEGKMIENGFLAQISPSITKKEEYGFIKSYVSSVAAFPANRETIMNILNNNELTNTFLKDTPPIIVYAKLEKSNSTFSGFQWSSSKGPSIHISSGTLCSVEVTVKEQAPITLVIPMLKKAIRIY